jgi:hypothetical protein
MRFRTHLLIAAAAGAAIYRRQPLRAALVAVGGVALDLDHFVLYALRSGDWNPFGALAYDRRRKRAPRAGDTRPRYGSLRSSLHRVEIALPLLGLLCARRPALLPFAIGMLIHLLLDQHPPHFDWRAWRRARGRCERCGVWGGAREVYFLVSPARGGDPWSLANRGVWCGACARAIR